MHHPDGGVFRKGSHVLEYWLVNSEGFTLARKPVKRRVTGVVLDPATGRAHSLIVRRSRRRTQVVAADAVTAVDVNGRVLYTGRTRRQRAQRHGGVWAAAVRRHTVTLGTHASQRSATAARRSAAFATRLWGLGVVHAQPLVAAAARTARRVANEVRVRLGPLAAAYAHNAATIARAYVHAARSRTLKR